jgi:hypothetical protein
MYMPLDFSPARVRSPWRSDGSDNPDSRPRFVTFHSSYSSKASICSNQEAAPESRCGLLKLTSLIVYLGVPAWALWDVHSRMTLNRAASLIAALGGTLALLALVQMLLTDAWYSLKVLRVIGARRRPPS